MAERIDEQANKLAAEVWEELRAAGESLKASEKAASEGNEAEAARLRRLAQNHKDRARAKKELVWDHLYPNIISLMRSFSKDLDAVGEVFEKFLKIMDRYEPNHPVQRGKVWSLVGRSLNN